MRVLIAMAMTAGCSVPPGDFQPSTDASSIDAPVDAGPPRSFQHVAHPILRDRGPTPTGSYEATGGRVLFFFGVSAQSPKAHGVMSVSLKLDDVTLGTLQQMTTEANSAKTLVSGVYLATVEAGHHTVTVVANDDMTVLGDHSIVDVTALELGDPALVTPIFANQPGLPSGVKFATGGRPGVLFLSAAAYGAVMGPLSVDVGIGGVNVGTVSVANDQAQSHKALVPAALQATPADGTRSLDLAHSAKTAVFFGDLAEALWLEPGNDVTITTLSGHLPLSIPLGEKPASLLLVVSGSALAGSGGDLSVPVKVDNVEVGQVTGYTTGGHMALLRGVFMTDVGATPHTIKVDLGNVTTDPSDIFTVVLFRTPLPD